jgi:uncharacterized protein YecT (DUF1311 family)
MKLLALTAVLILVPAMAFADDKVDCSNPQVQIEMNYCAEQAYKAADARLNVVYKKAMAAMKQIDSYLDADQRGAADSLRAAQRDWIPFRDKACEAEGYLVSGGSMQPLIIYECLTKLTGQRIGQLDFLVKGMGN